MRLRSMLLGLSLVVATGALAPLSALADPNGIFKRFTCGTSTDATILQNSSPPNLSILGTGKTIQASVNHESGGGTRAAGAIGKFIGYRPPRTGDGFQNCIINFKTGPDNVPSLSDVYAQFTFNFGGNTQVRTKAFNTMGPRGPVNGWRVVSANSLDFGGLNVKSSNLVKVVLYVQSTAGNPNKRIEFGNVEVQNFQGTPDSGFVTTGRGDCGDAGLPNPNSP